MGVSAKFQCLQPNVLPLNHYPNLQAINNNRSQKSAFQAAEIKIGISNFELQFVYGTCDVTDCISAEGVMDSLLFSLVLFKFFSSYYTRYKMGENQRVQIHQTVCEKLTEIVHLVNTTEYCFVDGSGICTIKINTVHKSEYMQFHRFELRIMI